MSNKPIPSFSGYVGTTLHALRLFHAARKGIIVQIKHPQRRTMVKSGAVFVFSFEKTGIRQWTDGLLWSPSQVDGNFLVCRQVEDDSLSKPSPFRGHLNYQGSFKPGALIKKSITVTVDGSEMHLVSYYTIKDKRSGKLKLPTSRPDIMSLYMPPHIFRLADFRVPPNVQIGSDGMSFLVESEELDQFEHQHGAWTRVLDSSENHAVLSDHAYPFNGSPSGSGSSWSANGNSLYPRSWNSTRCSIDVRTAQATISSFGASYLSSEDDMDTQYAHHGQEGRTTHSNDCGIQSEMHKNSGHRRRSHKSRAPRETKMELEAESMGNGMFANQPNPNPLQPWAYYPPPGFVIMMPLPVIQFAPMFGPTQCTNRNSGNVTNTYVFDSYNNGSTNLHNSEVQSQDKKGRRGRKRR